MGLIWLLAILGIGALAYFAIKGRMLRIRDELQEAIRRAGRKRGSSLPSEDMVKCAVCDTYIAPSQQKSCGKAGCPYQ
jgi:ArsR family metal-binding transcriptional regulator